MELRILKMLYGKIYDFIELETTYQDGHFIIGETLWWYSPVLDILQPCKHGVEPNMGADDWILLATTEDAVITDFGDYFTK